MSVPLVYLACFTMEPDFDATYRSWYVRRHVPDIMGLGFWTARAYVVADSASSATPGAARVWDMYEIADAELFSSAAYAAMQAGDPGIAEAFAHISDRSATIYDQELMPAAEGPIPSGDLVAARFGSLGGSSQEWVVDGAARLRENSGIADVRLCRHSTKQHPQAPSYEPEWLLLCSPAAGHDADGAQQLVRDALSAVPDLAVVVLRQWYGLAREDVWSAK